MATTKTTRTIYWISTGIIFLFEGVLTALTSHTDMAVEGIRHLGYPDYFRVLLGVCKVLGCLALVLPFVHGRIKEWAYAGLGFAMLSAFVSHYVVDGFHEQTFFPLFIFAILATSYTTYHLLEKRNKLHPQSFPYSSHAVSGIPHA